MELADELLWKVQGGSFVRIDGKLGSAGTIEQCLLWNDSFLQRGSELPKQVFREIQVKTPKLFYELIFKVPDHHFYLNHLDRYVDPEEQL